MKKVICFGEMLWDRLPSGRKPGGAPMNVAYHLRKLGAAPLLISAVGTDTDGDDLLRSLEAAGLGTDQVGRHPQLPTGTVDVHLDPDGGATYSISRPVAWDAIAYRPEWDGIRADAIVFGTLASREETSRNTLLRLLQTAKLRVLDLNLRLPHLERSTLDLLLKRADVLKINAEELRFLAGTFGLGGQEAEVLPRISRMFGIGTICVTQGANGAVVWTGSGMESHPGYKARVTDTVGAGDAFLAAFLAGLLEGLPWQRILARANATGAIVAGKEGGVPEYAEKDIQQLISGNF